MTTPMKVLWSQGLLLGPQHLVASDRYHSETLQVRLSRVTPDSYGVHKIEFDPTALQRKELSVTAFEGILPDGSICDFQQGEAICPLALTLPARIPSPKRVYLSLPKALSVVEDRRRYDALEAARGPDEDPEFEQVIYARPRLELNLEGAALGDHHSLAIGELNIDENGNYFLVPNFIPPSLCIAATPFLLTEVKNLIADLTTKCNLLFEQRRERDQVSLAYDQSDITKYLILQAIQSEHLVLQHHVAHAKTTPPRDLHLSFLRLIGALRAFVSNKSDLQAYDFDNLRGALLDSIAEIRRILALSTRDPFLQFGFDPRNDGMHLLPLTHEGLRSATSFYLAVRSPLAGEDVLRLVPQTAKVASWAGIGEVLQSATPGAQLVRVDQVPATLPTRAGEYYFAIPRDNPFWVSAMREQSVAVFLPAPFDYQQTSLRLIAMT